MLFFSPSLNTFTISTDREIARKKREKRHGLTFMGSGLLLRTTLIQIEWKK
jgi:hypothetical protein